MAINVFLGRTDDESFLRYLSGHQIRLAMKFETEKRRATQNVLNLLDRRRESLGYCVVSLVLKSKIYES